MGTSSNKIIVLSSVTAVLLALAVPVVPIAFFLAPLPLIFVTLLTALPLRVIWLIAAISNISMAFVYDITVMIGYFTLFTLPVLILNQILIQPHYMRNRQIWNIQYVLMAVLSIGLIGVGIFMIDPQLTENIKTEFTNVYNKYMANNGSTAQQSPEITAEMLLNKTPGILCIMWIVQMMVCTKLSSKIASIFKLNHISLGNFNNFRLPYFWDIITAVVLIITYIPGYIGTIASYALPPLGFGFMLIGIATTRTYLRQKFEHMHSKTNAVLFYITFLSLFVLLFNVASLLFGFLGLADHNFNLRGKLHKKSNT